MSTFFTIGGPPIITQSGDSLLGQTGSGGPTGSTWRVQHEASSLISTGTTMGGGSLVWILLVVGSVWLANLLPGAFGYQLGLVLGFVQIVKLALKPNQDMEADFRDTFKEYLA